MIALAALLLAAQPAQPTAPGPDRGMISLVVENDLFGGTDRNYSNGLRLEWVRPADDFNPWLRRAARTQPFVDLDGIELRDGFAVSHTLYTPRDITLEVPPADDHPYAAHLSVQFFAAASEANAENTVMIDIGLIGPSAGGEFIQESWHQLIDGEQPLGWDAQLKDEIVFAISGQRGVRHTGPNIGPLQLDALTHAGLTLGTLRTSASVGATVRAGFGLDQAFAPPRLRPAIGPSSLYRPGEGVAGYVFAGVGAYGVARDVFLDGNTFTDSASVEKYFAVADLQAGAAIHAGRYRLAFTYIVRTEQFQGQNGMQKFGAISLSRAF
ncbi:lipid A deacylase LpxR family protein [Maricaulaceae bacterium MS644]